MTKMQPCFWRTHYPSALCPKKRMLGKHLEGEYRVLSVKVKGKIPETEDLCAVSEGTRRDSMAKKDRWHDETKRMAWRKTGGLQQCGVARWARTSVPLQDRVQGWDWQKTGDKDAIWSTLQSLVSYTKGFWFNLIIAIRIKPKRTKRQWVPLSLKIIE